MLIELEKVSKAYSIKGNQPVQVLKDIDFRLYRGDFTAIVGASGVGKSTLLHILGSLDKQDNGSVKYYFDSTPLELSKATKQQLNHLRNRNIGFVFQFHHLLPEFTALENVIMPGLIAGEKYRVVEAKAKLLFEKTGITGKENNKPSELSGGEQQRVAISRALINQPDLLIADEPTGNLDDKSTEQFLSLLARLRHEFGLTILVATHSRDVAAFADKTMTLGAVGFC